MELSIKNLTYDTVRQLDGQIIGTLLQHHMLLLQQLALISSMNDAIQMIARNAGLPTNDFAAGVDVPRTKEAMTEHLYAFARNMFPGIEVELTIE